MGEALLTTRKLSNHFGMVCTARDLDLSFERGVLTSIIGLHFAAAVFLFFYMRVVGKIGWLECALVSILFPLAMYIVFDRLFLIPLPDGMLGNYIKLPF